MKWAPKSSIKQRNRVEPHSNPRGSNPERIVREPHRREAGLTLVDSRSKCLAPRVRGPAGGKRPAPAVPKLWRTSELADVHATFFPLPDTNPVCAVPPPFPLLQRHATATTTPLLLYPHGVVALGQGALAAQADKSLFKLPGLTCTDLWPGVWERWMHQGDGISLTQIQAFRATKYIKLLVILGVRHAGHG